LKVANQQARASDLARRVAIQEAKLALARQDQEIALLELELNNSAK